MINEQILLNLEHGSYWSQFQCGEWGTVSAFQHQKFLQALVTMRL